MNGRYIVFEGVVGTGKTTQSKMLVDYLTTQFPGREVLWTREPGGSEIAEAISKVVQATPFVEQIDAVCEAYLYAAARAQSLRTVVQPVLDRGGIVIADRSVFSSVAWQGFGQGAGFDAVWNINKSAVSTIIPDAVLYLDLDVTTGISRTFDAAGDKFEKFPAAFFEKCREGYTAIATDDRFRALWHTIDATGSREEVFARIVATNVFAQ